MLATALFNGIEVANAIDDCGKPFKFKGAWEVLRSHDKFMAGTMDEKSSTISTSPEPAEIVEEEKVEVETISRANKKPSPAVSDHPVGREKPKEEQCQAKYAENKIELAAQSVAAELERNKVLKRHYEIMLFTSASAGCNNEESLEYFCIMRAQALEEVRKEWKKSRTEKNAFDTTLEVQGKEADGPEKEDNEEGVSSPETA